MYKIWSCGELNTHAFTRGNDLRTLLASVAAKELNSSSFLAGCYFVTKDDGPHHGLHFGSPREALKAAGREPRPIKAMGWGHGLIEG